MQGLLRNVNLHTLNMTMLHTICMTLGEGHTTEIQCHHS